MRKTVVTLALTLLSASGWGQSALEEAERIGKEMDTYPPLYRLLGGLENRRDYYRLYQTQVTAEERSDKLVDQFVADTRKLVAQLRQANMMPVEADKLESDCREIEAQWVEGRKVRRLRQVVAAIALGNTFEALRILRSMESEVSPDVGQSLNATQVVLSFRLGRPDLAEQALQRYRAQTEAERSMADTARQALAQERTRRLDVSRFLEEHGRAWPRLMAVQVSQESNFSDWATAYWPGECGRLLYRLDSADPQRAALKQLLESDLADLQRSGGQRFLLDPMAGGQLHPEWSAWRWISSMDLLLGVAEEARLAGAWEESQSYLTRFEQQALPELERLPARLAPVNQLLLAPKSLQVDFREGAISRLQGRWREGRARLQQAREAGKPSAGVHQELESALRLYRQALAGHQALLLSADLTLARLAAGDSAGAQQLVGAALQEAAASQDRVASIRLQLAQGRLGLRSHPEAHAPLAQALSEYEKFVQEVGAGSDLNNGLRDFAQGAYRELAEAQADPANPQAALAVLARMQQSESLAEVSPRLPQLEPVRSQLRSLEQESVALHAVPEAAALNGEARRQNVQLLARKRGEFYTLMGKIRKESPEFESSLAIRPVNFSEVQAHIPADCAVVQFFPAETKLYYFTVTRESLKIRSLPLARTQLEGWIREYRRQINIPASGRSGDLAALQQLSQQLYNTLVEPVAEDLRSKSVVAFVPSGMLHYLPLQSLRDPQGKYLVETKQVAILAKSNDLERLGRPALKRTGSLLAFGNPDGSLPAAAGEVRAIGKLFPKPELLLAGQARKQRLLQPGKDMTFLHFATHGHLNASDPSQSYLVLAGDREEGRLTAAEIADLDLSKRTRLVTLSACQTAIGERQPGSEVTSLADAFRWAGSPTLVASLWKVSDDATQLLMVEFYTRLRAGATPAAALRSAQLKLMKQPAYQHPFFWSSFELVGDWR